MSRTDSKNHFIDALVFLALYAFCSVSMLWGGSGTGARSYIATFAAFFGILESLKIFFFRMRFWIPLFVVGAYLSACLANLVFAIGRIAYYNYKGVPMFLIDPDEFITILLVSLLFSSAGYFALFARRTVIFILKRRKSKKLEGGASWN